MTTVIIRFVIALVFASVCVAVEKEHEMCCNYCVSNYATSSNLKTACLRGCRLYGMIFLAHDRSVERSEIAGLCGKSCSGAADVAACGAGCARQERVFREHSVGGHVARLAVMFGLPSAPLVHSPAPHHGRMFARMRPAGAPPVHAWLRAVRIHIRPMPAGPDGRPRYWVEISEHRIPLRLTAGPSSLSGRHHQLQQLPHHGPSFLARMSHLTHRAGFRWVACSLLVASLVGILWFCCGFFCCSAGAPRVRVLRLTGVLRKQPPPSVQSGDIFCVNTDKKPLLLAEEIPEVAEVKAAETA